MKGKTTITMNPNLKKWQGAIKTVKIGRTKEEGGTREYSLEVGGSNCLPLHRFEGEISHRPAIALEVTDMIPEDWVEAVMQPFIDVLDNAVEWAKRAASNCPIDAICLHMRGAQSRGMEKSMGFVKDFLSEVKLPVILQGSGESDFQDDFLAKCAEAAAGEGLLLASATENHYKTAAAAAIAYDHALVAETPIDVNLAKQLNILLSEMNLPPEKIVIDPLTGGLGYGLEYTYSVMERIRIQALKGDKFMVMPFINFIGDESWRVKEVKMDEPAWGNKTNRGVYWETANAVSLLLAGAEILVLRHPESAILTRKAINEFMTSGKGA